VSIGSAGLSFPPVVYVGVDFYHPIYILAMWIDRSYMALIGNLRIRCWLRQFTITTIPIGPIKCSSIAYAAERCTSNRQNPYGSFATY
jgi:hypothetical protein